MAHPSERETFQVLLYDWEDYAGAGRGPGWRPGMARWTLSAFRKNIGGPSWAWSLVWTAGAETLSEALALVPRGGRHFDRTGNWPSPMVPVEGWYYESEHPAPAHDTERAAAAI